MARYAEGVHRLGPPAVAKAVAGLPAELAGFLRSFDGADLFIDALSIRPAAELAREADLLVFGHNANGDRLALDPDGAVLLLEEDTGEVLVEGTSFARWLEGWIAAEGTLYDREGEFREGAFDEEDLSAAAAEKRERRALKVDPGAPAPAWRLARALVRQGQAAKARRVLGELTERAPGFAWAWFDRGRLAREAGELDEAEACFRRAAEADPEYEHAGYFWANAARAAADETARTQHAARALAADPDVGRTQREAARQLADEGRDAEAREAAEVAAAVLPRDLEVLALVRRLSAPASRSPRPSRRERPPRRTPR